MTQGCGWINILKSDLHQNSRNTKTQARCFPESGSRLNDDAAQITVEDDPAVCRGGTNVPEKIQDACPHLRAEPFIKVLFRHHGQQPFATFAVRLEALADVHGVGDAVLLIPETQRLQQGLDVSGRAVLGDGADAQLVIIGLPHGFKAAVL